MIKTVYHGSFKKFDAPELSKCKDYRDFGKGFYVTEHFFDALSILKAKEGYVYEYELDIRGALIKEFFSDEEIVEYITLNRTTKFSDLYDLVIGKTACSCSNLFKKIRNGQKDIDKDEILKTIISSTYEEQICIKTEKFLNKLKLKNVHSYSREDFC